MEDDQAAPVLQPGEVVLAGVRVCELRDRSAVPGCAVDVEGGGLGGVDGVDGVEVVLDFEVAGAFSDFEGAWEGGLAGGEGRW